MPRAPRELAGFIALPVTLRGGLTKKDVEHYIFVKAHEPRVPDDTATRSLFLVNVPVTGTKTHLRHLFAVQLGAGIVEEVTFLQGHEEKLSSTSLTVASKKRKRQTVDELEASLDQYYLPAVFTSHILTSGSAAVVTFVDRPSMERGLRAVRHGAKSANQLVWARGIESELPSDATGLKRYDAHKLLQFPPRSALLKIVDTYMTGYAALESARSTESARKKALPDEDGFVTVTRGNKGSILSKDEAEDLRAKQRAKETGLEDFYRFQTREKRKEQAGEFLKKFEEDKRKIAEMRRQRGSIKPES